MNKGTKGTGGPASQVPPTPSHGPRLSKAPRLVQCCAVLILKSLILEQRTGHLHFCMHRGRQAAHSDPERVERSQIQKQQSRRSAPRDRCHLGFSERTASGIPGPTQPLVLHHVLSGLPFGCTCTFPGLAIEFSQTGHSSSLVPRPAFLPTPGSIVG